MTNSEDFAMKYAVMHKGRMVLRTDDLQEAREKMRKCGSHAYVQYAARGIEEYQEQQPKEEVPNE